MMLITLKKWLVLLISMLKYLFALAKFVDVIICGIGDLIGEIILSFGNEFFREIQ